MTDREAYCYNAFARIQTFGTDNAADFAPGSLAITNFTALTPVVSGLGLAKSGQVTPRDTSKPALLAAIQADLKNITRTAEAIDQTQPGFADNFRAPAQANPAAILTTADNFIQQLAAQPGDSPATVTAKAALVAQFVAHEMAAAFVTTLQSDRAAYSAQNIAHETKREDGVGSTATVGMLITQGMQITTTLDAIMHNKYSGQPAKMAAWHTASHIEHAAHHAKTVPPATPPTPPAV